MRKNIRIISFATLLLSVILLLTSCGSVSGGYDGIENGYYDSDYAKGESMSDSMSNTVTDGGLGMTGLPTEQTERKIIYTAWAELQTKEYEQTITSLKELCNKHGAYFESSNSYGNRLDYQSERSAKYVIRIPIKNYTAFLEEVSGIGSVVSSGENNQDITEKYIDTEARLESAKLREDRVLVLLENAARLDDILSLERELADIRYEIETLTGSLRKYNSLISYATFTLSVDEVIEYTEPVVAPKTFGEKLAHSFSEGWASFINYWQNIAIVIAYAFPFLVSFGAAAIIVVVIVAILNKRKKKKKENVTRTASVQSDTKTK